MRLFQKTAIGLLLLVPMLFSINSGFATCASANGQTCCNCTAISKKSFLGKNNATKSLVITKPGKYCLTENISFALQASVKKAIIIDSDNVTINLNRFFLNQGNSEAGGVGIFVKEGRNNISIINGTLSGWTDHAIRFKEANDTIFLSQLLVKANNSGIFLGPINFTQDPSEVARFVSNVKMTNCRILENGVGFTMNAQKSVLIENCNVDGTVGTATPPFGDVSYAGLINGLNLEPALFTPEEQQAVYLHDLKIINSTFNNGVNVANSLGVNQVRNLYIKGCQFNDNELNGFIASGFISGALVNTVIENCQANNNTIADVNLITCGYHFSGNDATGLQSTSTLTMRNCEAIANKGFSTVSGFDINYQNNLWIENCRASKNHCLNSPDAIFPVAAGFLILSSAGISGPGSAEDDQQGSVNNSTFIDCIASHNIAEQSICSGFQWLGGNFKLPTNIQHNVSFINCVAEGNASHADSSTAPGVGAGILIDRGVFNNLGFFRVPEGFFPSKEYRNINVIGCILSGNHGVTEAGKPFSGGLTILGADAVNVIENTSTGNTNGFVLSGGLNFAGVKIDNTSNSVVQNNTAVKNIDAGFKDSQTHAAIKNAFIGNTAMKNGVNYDLTPASEKINNISIN